MSLNLGRCPISELTTHSPRMVNLPSLCTHTRLDAMLPSICNANIMEISHVTCMMHTVELRIEYPIWLEHKCSGIYNFCFYPLTHQGSHAFHKNRRKDKRNLPLVDRFVKTSKSAPWFIRIFKSAAFLKNDHPLQVSTHEQIMNDLAEC